MGLAWSFFTPLLMLAVYTFVFSVVFKARWGDGGEQSNTGFAVVMFVGMIDARPLYRGAQSCPRHDPLQRQLLGEGGVFA